MGKESDVREVSALISQKLRVVNPDYLSESISHETILSERLPIARDGPENQITGVSICAMVNVMYQRGTNTKLTGARLRKIVNHLRTNGILPIIATQKGYCSSYDTETIQAQIRSLKERAAGIRSAAHGLSRFLTPDQLSLFNESKNE